MIKRLDWYIIRKFVVTFFMSLLFLAVLIIIFDISEKIDDFVRKEVPIREIAFDYYLNFVPFFMNQYSPMFVFLTVIFFTSKMTQDSEIVAILSSGISYHRLVRPYILSAALIAVFSLVMGMYILPPANAIRVQFEQKYNPYRKVKMGHDMHYKLENDHFVYFESFSAYNNTAYNFTLEDLSGGRLNSKLTAESAQYDTVSGVWKLRNYFIRDYDEGLNDHIRSGRQLDTVLSMTREDFFRNRYTIQQLNQRELNELIETQTMRGDASVNMSLIEKHNRFSLPVSAFILTIIGLSLCTKKKRGGMGWNLAAGTALGFSYILFMQFSEMFVVTDTLPAQVAVWMPNVLYAIIAVVLYIKAPKESNASSKDCQPFALSLPGLRHAAECRPGPPCLPGRTRSAETPAAGDDSHRTVHCVAGGLRGAGASPQRPGGQTRRHRAQYAGYHRRRLPGRDPRDSGEPVGPALRGGAGRAHCPDGDCPPRTGGMGARG